MGNAMWKPGEVIAGLYEVRRVFLSGGMGEVYLVHHRDWDMPLALKRPRLAPTSSEESVSAFRRECELWVGLQLHPHVVTCYYVRTIDAVPCVLTEYVDGGSLRDWIVSRRLYSGTEETALARILDVAIQSAWGLECAHTTGLVHQDVKPGNILLASDGTAKVTDFGLAKVMDGSDFSSHESRVVARDSCVSVNGMTPAYCSPEQARRERVSCKTDIYSWAVAVLEMFKGDVTWATGPAARYALQEMKGQPSSLDLPGMPEGVYTLLARCMEESPDARPIGFCEIADWLQEVFLDVFGEPYDRLRPDAEMSEDDSLNNRALSMLDLGHLKEAQQLLQMILKDDAIHPEALFNLMMFNLNRNQTSGDDAVLAVARIVQQEPDLWGGWLLLAEMQTRVGMRREALESLETALGLVSDVPSRQVVSSWKMRIADGKPVSVPYAVARPRSGAEYYEERRKFERLCAKMQRALATNNREDAVRYLQQAREVPSFRRHPKLKALIAKITRD